MNKPGRTEGVRKTAARFGIDPGAVQRTFDGVSARHVPGRRSLKAGEKR
jgi:hypothetical protein